MAKPSSSLRAVNDLAAIILAGGLSRRLGTDKAFVKIGELTLLERAVARVGGLISTILLVTSQKGQELFEESGLVFGPRVSLVTDLYPGKGSLGGIYSGLAISPAFRNLVVACDMPFLNRHLLAYMVRQAPGSDVVIPRLGDILEPLHAIYSKDCLGPMKALLDRDDLKILDLFPQVRVRYIEEEEMTPLDPQRLSFFNVNTAADLQRAQELEKALGPEIEQAGGPGMSPVSPDQASGERPGRNRRSLGGALRRGKAEPC